MCEIKQYVLHRMIFAKRQVYFKIEWKTKFHRSFLDENAKYFVKLKELVEETYENSEKCPVYLLGHSLGSLYSMYFLKLQDKRWKHKYIKGFISVSGPFGGSVESLYAETCGESKNY